MKLLDNRVFRRLLLSFTYAVGVFLIVASGGSSGGGSSSSDDSCRIVISAISPVTGTDDIWVGVISQLPSGEFNSVARLERDGTEAFPPVSLASGFENVIRTVAVAADGSNDVYVGGDFSEGIFRLNADGSLDNTFDVGSGFNDSVSTIVPAADGSGDIYVGGFFSEYQGVVVSGLVRLNDDGSRDTGFITITQAIQAIELTGPLHLLWELYNGGEVIPRVQRRSSIGTTDPNFNPLVTDGPVYSIADAIDDYSVYIGGGFSGGIYRLNRLGLIDAAFVVGSGFNESVRKVVHTEDSTGDLYAVGGFTAYQGSAANGLVRLNDDGSLDINFSTGSGFSNSGGPVPFGEFAASVLAADASGDLYVGGNFTDYDGTSADGLVRVDSSGMLDPDFAARISSETGTCIDGTFVEDEKAGFS